MSSIRDRRQFLRQMLALTITGVGASACRTSKPTAVSPAPAEPVQAVAATPGAAAAKPTLAPALVRPSPSAPRAASPTQAAVQPTAQPPAAPAGASPTAADTAYLAVARGSGADPAELTRRAIAALGGIERFVKPGANVILKPNICTAYYGPEYASTTNPQVVAAVVALCLGAGAKRVRVMDAPFGGTAQNAYVKSGIADAVQAAGGEMEVMSRMRYRALDLPNGRKIQQWQVYGDALDADVLINLPIAKDHGSTRLTLGMKNMMGLIQDRSGFHSRGLDQCIADLNSSLRPQLTVVDAVRILMENGPTGGNLNDVKATDTVIASADVVAADAYAATLFGMTGKDIGYIRLGAEMGLGQMDLNAIKTVEIPV